MIKNIIHFSFFLLLISCSDRSGSPPEGPYYINKPPILVSDKKPLEDSNGQISGSSNGRKEEVVTQNSFPGERIEPAPVPVPPNVIDASPEVNPEVSLKEEVISNNTDVTQPQVSGEISTEENLQDLNTSEREIIEQGETEVVNENRGEGEVINNVENFSEGEDNNLEVEEQERSTALLFPVSIDLKKDKGEEELVGLKGLHVIDYFLKEKYLTSRILNQDYKLPKLKLLEKSFLITEIRKSLHKFNLKLELDSSWLKSNKDVELESIRLKIYRKIKKSGELIPYSLEYIDFKEDYLRRIKEPFYFKDQNFSVKLNTPLIAGDNNQFLITVDEAIIVANNVNRKISLKRVLEGSRLNCFLRFKKTLKMSSGNNECSKFFEKNTSKLVLSEDGFDVLSLSDRNNGFLISPPSKKFSSNVLTTFGFFYDFTKKNEMFLTSFSYRELLKIIGFKRSKFLRLSELQNNFLEIERFTNLRVRIKSFHKGPTFQRKIRHLTIREGGAIRDTNYYQISSEQVLFDSYKRKIVKHKKRNSRSFKIDGVKLFSKDYFFEDRGGVVKNSSKPLRQKAYKLGDQHPKVYGRIITSDYQKPFKKDLINDTYEEVVLTFFEPDW